MNPRKYNEGLEREEYKMVELRNYMKMHIGDIKYVYKIQNTHLNLLIQNKDIDKIRQILPKYMEYNIDVDFFGSICGSEVDKDLRLKKDYKSRWDVQIQNLAQARLLEHFIDIIPKGDCDPSKYQWNLNIESYIAIMKYLAENKLDEQYQWCLENFKINVKIDIEPKPAEEKKDDSLKKEDTPPKVEEPPKEDPPKEEPKPKSEEEKADTPEKKEEEPKKDE